MSADLSAIVLILGATIVPWLLWMFTRVRCSPASDTQEPKRLETTLVPQVADDEPDGAVRTLALQQLRPDGVVLDRRDESSIACR